jgi:thiosulfate reductase cytochrome b subunit
MVMSRSKLVLTAVVCLVMAPLPILTGMRAASPSQLAAFFGALPWSVWLGLATMAVLVAACWLSIDAADEGAGE